MKITLTDPRTTVTLQPRNFTVTLSGARGPAGQGLPAGGAEGQIIVKQSATDYDTAWADNYATNVELYVKNSTASAMTKGQVVYVSGADGNNPTVTLAQATSEGGSSKTIGVLKQDLAVGAQGYVITDGLLEGLNTNSASAAGDTIWLSPTIAGGVVYGDANKPSAPNHMVFIGYVLRKNTNNGKIFVKVMNGFELQELHNVAISSPVTGQVLKYNGTTGLWSNDTDTGGINTLNGLTTSSQSFATGTSGTDFSIVSATGTHTFNLPTASASARGLLSSADWSTFNSKQSALSFDSTPTNGSTNPVTSDGVFDALALKQNNLTLTTTGTSGAATLTGATLNIPQYQSALTNPVTGTGTSGQVAYFNGTSTVTGSNNLFWDAVNGRLGIGTNAPVHKLQVIGNAYVESLFTIGGRVIDYSAALQKFGDLSGARDVGFYANNIESFRIFSTNRNVSIGTSSDLSARLGIRGSGTTSSTTALLVQNGTPSSLFSVRDDGVISVGSNASNTQIRPVGSTGLLDINGQALTFIAQGNIDASGFGAFNFSGFTMVETSGFYRLVNLSRQFAPTSGTAQMYYLQINPTINQTGGANGITTGINIAPSLTAAADWRSISWSNNTGWGLYGAGTANNYLGGNTAIGTSTVQSAVLTIGGSGTQERGISVNKTFTGGTSRFGILQYNTVNSDVTSTAINCYSQFATQEAAFTLTNARHYSVADIALGAGSSVTNQVGFYCGSISLATNNYAFQGTITAGTGRWNLYMSGTAANYLAGDTAIGTTTTSGGRLTVRGSTTTSAANSLLVEDSAGTDLFVVRNDGGYAFKGGTVGVAQTGYTTFTNLTTDRTCDANATTVDELADILGTLIEDLKTKGIISA